MIIVEMDDHAKYALVAVCLVVAAIVLNSGYLSPAAPEEGAQAAPANQEYMYACDLQQGFNFDNGRQDTVCHINSLKIGSDEYVSDLTVNDPETGQPVNVFGVGSNMFWVGGYADPVHLMAQISTANKNLIATMVHTSMSNTEMELSFTVYDYDPVAGRYYKAFHTDGKKLKCRIQKSGGELNLEMGTDQGMEVMSPRNFALTFGAMPNEEYREQQYIHTASSVSATEPKQFGRA